MGSNLNKKLKTEIRSQSGRSFFDGAVDVSQVIAKRVTGVGGSLLKVTGEVQLRAQRASGFDRFRLLPLPPPNFPGGCK